MKFNVRSTLLVAVVLGLLVTVVAWLASFAMNRSGNAAEQMTEAVTPELIAKGAYLARAGDCVACHTRHGGGKPFAGGLGIKSPIGTIFSTNITPAVETGIGRWSYGEFERAVRRGIGHDGSALYPAMPFPSYASTTAEDTRALYAYFMQGVAPVEQANTPDDIPWPLSLRWPLAYWRTLFAPSPESLEATTNPGVSVSEAEKARGAYLVQGLGHCGSCHTPRALTMQEKALDDSSPDYLAGAELNGWSVPALRGVRHWTKDEIVDYLGSGRNNQASVAGEMTDVVANSTSHMTDDDLQAIAAYLKSIEGGKPVYEYQQQRSVATAQKLTAAKDLTLGERLYIDNCNACHFVAGNGAARVFPKLDGASIINAENPTALIQIMLAGTQTPSTERSPSVLPMPGFANRLDDAEAAQLATFLRQAWSNKASMVSDQQVKAIRQSLSAGLDKAQTSIEPSKGH